MQPGSPGCHAGNRMGKEILDDNEEGLKK